MVTTAHQPPPLLAAALAATERGWPVFPLHPRSKIPALHHRDRCPGTGACAQGHLGWSSRATTDPDLLVAWWRQRAYNIGIATGPAGLVVLDLDHAAGHGANAPNGPTHGVDVLARLAAEAGQPVPLATYTVHTPGGGHHLYYQAPSETTIRNSTGPTGLGCLIDVRATGGLIIAAGSTLPHGCYRRDTTRPTEPAPLPRWLVQRLAPPAPPPPMRDDLPPGHASAYVQGALRRRTAAVRAAPVGTRHSTLLSAAAGLGRFVGAGQLNYDDARAHLLGAAQTHIGTEGFTTTEAETTIHDGLTWGSTRA
ncbi:hypothetical protein FHX42_001206 [Saccharopolyspora lacisalsi]|uniref:DNA primase/polymerase bifunctional N-terminal domain-containing protein n=1 Tax=Halosaccharopolyspora lacisalsi TaxID=1000566 RepID=A0A839DWQ2_9PSEU|nr:bifunctional DNA primase/polymerase [Halosaccharopolyspora lacisalsi]MBA8823877.1 hypothetical protein [Halosaccharopolyspora lacisalsi]